MTACGSTSPTPQQMAPSSVAGIAIQPIQISTAVPATSSELSNADLNAVPPQNVLQEVSYSGGFGGGNSCPAHNYQNPTFLDTGSDGPFELLQDINIPVCGLSLNEQVRIKIVLPDNSTKEITQAADQTYGQNVGEVDFIYTGNLGDPTGIYHFYFSGDNWTLEKDVPISDIQFPRLYYDREHNQLLFVKFRPSEAVRLYVYSSPLPLEYSLLGWKDLQVNEGGLLSIDLNLQVATYTELGFVAIGQQSGEVPFWYKGTNYGKIGGSIIKSSSSSSAPTMTGVGCPGLLPPRLQIGKYAFVSTNPPLSNRLRSGPSTSENVNDMLTPGTVMQVLDGPKCSDGLTFWHVKGVQRIFDGWTAEGDGSSYWLLPCDTPDLCH